VQATETRQSGRPRWTQPLNKTWRPVLIDKPYVVLRRLRAQVRLRAILYGLPREARAPCWGDKKGDFYCREEQWAWLFRDYCRCLFMYSEFLNEARRFVSLHGTVQRLGPGKTRQEYLDNDLATLKAFDRYIKKRVWEEKLWGRHKERMRDKAAFMADLAKSMARDCALSGVCVFCGASLPCVPCQVPTYEIDGKGWVRPIPDPRITRTA